MVETTGEREMARAGRSARETRWWGVLGLAIVLMLVCYAIAVNSYWVGDDYNYLLPKGWDSVLRFFNPVGRALYRPLNWSIWAADFSLFGLQPLGWHLTRLAMHALNIVWAGLLIRAITGRRDLALASAALFAVHPSQTETVTWMGGMADLSFAVAWLPALWLWVRWRKGASWRVWWLAGLLGFVSMLGKEAAFTLPLVSVWADLIFGRDWARWPGKRAKGWWREWRLYPILLRDHSLFIASSGLFVAMRLYLYLTGQGRLMYGLNEQFAFLTRGVDVLTGYILLALGAWWLPPETSGWPTWIKLGIIVVTAIALVMLVRWLGKVALFAVGWVGLTLLLTTQVVASRWFYIPALGVSLLVACVWARLRADLRRRQRRAGGWRRLAVASPLLMLVWWSLVTTVYNDLWRQSGEVARGILAQVRALHPDPARPATFYVANPPYSYKGVLLFNSGFDAAMRVVYADWSNITSYSLDSLEGNQAQVRAALADPSKVGPNPIFLRYEGGRIVDYPSLQALVAANANK